MVTNSDNFPGYKIVKSHGIVTVRYSCSEIVLYGEKIEMISFGKKSLKRRFKS